MNRHTIIYSMYRVDALRTSSRLRAGYPTLLQWRGRYDFSRLKTSPWLPHVRVGNRVFSHSIDVVFKMYMHIIYSYFFTCTISETLYNKLITQLLFFLALLRFVEFCHTQCPCINGARLSVLHMVQLYM